ncbi:MAG: hypothetical protein ACRDZU_16990 [Acidimicrobiales bacterium]
MAAPSAPAPGDGHAHAGPGLWVGLALGLPVIGWGIRGVLADSGDTHPAELGRWIIGAALVHDALVVPIALAVAVVARRIVPARSWPLIRWALATTGVLALVSWPFVRGYGRSRGNPSLLPRDYTMGVLVTIGITWTVAIGLAGLDGLRSHLEAKHRHRRPTSARG